MLKRWISTLTCLGWPRAPHQHTLTCASLGSSPVCLPESIFRFFLEPQINWKRFTSVGVF